MRVLSQKQMDFLRFAHGFIEATGMPAQPGDVRDAGFKNASLLVYALAARGMLKYERGTEVYGDGRHARGLFITAALLPGAGWSVSGNLVEDAVTGQCYLADHLAEIELLRVERRCLCCSGIFISTHKYHRLCDLCREDGAEGSDEYGTGYISNGEAIRHGWVGGKFMDGRR